MTEHLDERIAAGLKRAMKEGRITMRELERRTKIPYRSLQNYLSTTTRMPAGVYVQLCEAIGVDNQYVLEGSFHLRDANLYDALLTVFGDGAADFHFEPRTSTGTRRDDAIRLASEFARKLSNAYHAEALHNLGKGHFARSLTSPQVEAKEQARRGHQ